MADRVEVEVLAQTKGANQNLTKYISKLALATAAALGLKKVTIDQAKAGLKYAGSLDSLNAAFSVLLRDGAAAKDLMGEIQQFAASTPFQMEQLANATKLLINTGTDVSQVTAVLESLGNAAMGQPEIMDRLVDAYGKLQVKGRASLEELNRFMEAGVPILDVLQTNLGVTKEELFKMISAGKIQFGQVNDALTTLTTGEGKLAGLIKVQSETLPGLLSTAKDVIDQIRGGAMSAFLPAIKQGLANIITWLQDVAKNVTSWAEQNQATIFAIFTRLPDIIDTAISTGLAIIRQAFTGQTMINIMKIFGQYASDALRLGISTIPFLFKTVLKVAENGWEAFGDNAGKYLVNGIVNAILTGPRWIASLLRLITGNENLRIGRIDLFDMAGNAEDDAREFAALLSETFESAGLEARTMISQQMTNWSDAVKKVAAQFEGPFAKGAEKINKILEEGRAAFEEWSGAALSAGETIDDVADSTDELFQGLVEWLRSIPSETQKVAESITSAATSALGSWAGAFEAMAAAQGKQFLAAKEFAAAEVVINAIVAMIKAVKDYGAVGGPIVAGLIGLGAAGAIAKIYATEPGSASAPSGGMFNFPQADHDRIRRENFPASANSTGGGNRATANVYIGGSVVAQQELQGAVAGTITEMQRGY